MKSLMECAFMSKRWYFTLKIPHFYGRITWEKDILLLPWNFKSLPWFMVLFGQHQTHNTRTSPYKLVIRNTLVLHLEADQLRKLLAALSLNIEIENCEWKQLHLGKKIWLQCVFSSHDVVFSDTMEYIRDIQGHVISHFKWRCSIMIGRSRKWNIFEQLFKEKYILLPIWQQTNKEAIFVNIAGWDFTRNNASHSWMETSP